ncbi:hypothetical protein CLV48_106210 [Cecembia rubra]|uniref:Uncharacterized protein n=1 Tax=Cecembia rubra TaxID=1485585 RepID=A0A2P8E3C9_9BACT|nr:hypothetical protein CLV48_106210 [Cecembia rubra]
MSNYLNTALKELFYEKDLRALGALCGRNFLNHKAHEGTRRSERREAGDELREARDEKRETRERYKTSSQNILESLHNLPGKYRDQTWYSWWP